MVADVAGASPLAGPVAGGGRVLLRVSRVGCEVNWNTKTRTSMAADAGGPPAADGATSLWSSALARACSLHGFPLLSAAASSTAAAEASDGEEGRAIAACVTRVLTACAPHAHGAFPPAQPTAPALAALLADVDVLRAAAGAATTTTTTTTRPAGWRDVAADAAHLGASVATLGCLHVLLRTSADAAASLRPLVEFWRQRDGGQSVLLGPLAGGLHGRHATAAALLADVAEGGPWEWAGLLLRAGRDALARALTAGAALAPARPHLLMGTLPPSPPGQAQPVDTASHATLPTLSRALAALGAALTSALARAAPVRTGVRLWGGGGVGYAYATPATKAEALTALQRPLFTAAGAAEAHLTRITHASTPAALDAALGSARADLATALGVSQPAPAAPPSAARTADVDALNAAVAALAALPGATDAAAHPLRARSGLRRYWAVWVALGAGSLYTARTVSRNRSELAAAACEVVASLARFYDEHLRGPVGRMRGELFGAAPVAAVADAGALEDARASLAAMLTDYSRRVDRATLSPSLAHADLPALAAALDMRPVSEAYVAQVRNPVRSAVSGDLLELMLIQIAFIKKELLAAMGALDAILAENRFNLQVMATVPALLVTSMLGAGAMALTRAATAPIDTGGPRHVMRLALRDAARLLALADAEGMQGVGGAGAVDEPLLSSPADTAAFAALWRTLRGGGTGSASGRAVEELFSAGGAEGGAGGSGGGGAGLERAGRLLALQRQLRCQLLSFRRQVGWDEWDRLGQDLAVSDEWGACAGWACAVRFFTSSAHALPPHCPHPPPPHPIPSPPSTPPTPALPCPRTWAHARSRPASGWSRRCACRARTPSSARSRAGKVGQGVGGGVRVRACVDRRKMPVLKRPFKAVHTPRPAPTHAGAPSSSPSGGATNGFAISRSSSSGHTTVTCVPRHTTRPRPRVPSVMRRGSAGSVGAGVWGWGGVGVVDR